MIIIRIKLIERITDTMSKSAYSLDDFGRKIEEHQNYSTKNLNSINNDLIEIKKDLSAVSGMSDKMATKEGLKEVKDKVVMDKTGLSVMTKFDL